MIIADAVGLRTSEPKSGNTICHCFSQLRVSTKCHDIIADKQSVQIDWISIVVVWIVLKDDAGQQKNKSPVSSEESTSSEGFRDEVPSSTLTPSRAPFDAFTNRFELRAAIVKYLRHPGPDDAMALQYGYPIGQW